jgi:hypothetical protein
MVRRSQWGECHEVGKSRYHTPKKSSRVAGPIPLLGPTVADFASRERSRPKTNYKRDPPCDLASERWRNMKYTIQICRL